MDSAAPQDKGVFEGLLSRAQGCLIGLLVGDSLGSLVEFCSEKRIAQDYPNGVRDLANGGTWDTLAGQPTDDGELALTLAHSLVEQGDYRPNSVVRAYGDWYTSGPFDMGATTAQAFRVAAMTGDASQVRKAANQQSQANGALMRIAPLVISGWRLPPELLAEIAREDAKLSHPHEVCQDANAVFVMALQYAMRTGSVPADVYRHTQNWAKTSGVCGDVLQSLADAGHGPPADYKHQMGWVRIAFQNAFYQLLHAESLEEGIIDTVGRGGDTDTNACIAGALLGAVYGVGDVPPRWLNPLIHCRPEAGLPGVAKPRPKKYWPSDALELAKALVGVLPKEKT